ncbi:hybrid sensor histidine kinase/response regulator [Mucilaginibacter limnophilus]|nr:response regulator [Mucilaginibacter limnophilus]
MAFGWHIACAQTPGSKDLLKKLQKIKDADSSRVYADQLLKLAHEHNDKAFEAQVLNYRAFKVYTNGDELQALELARKAHTLTTPADSFTYVKSATMTAYMLSRRGNDIEALKTAFDILKKADAHGWKSLSADCRLCIADLYRTIDKPQQALPYAEQAARDVLSVRDTGMYIFALSTLSNLYSNRGMDTPVNLNKAIGYMEVILNKPYADKLSIFERARYLSNLGRLYEILNKLEKAEKVLLEAIDICRKGKYPAIEKHALNELTTVKIDQGKYREAIKYAHEALAVQADAQSSRINQRNIYRQLRRAYAGLKNYEMAFEYAEKATALNDSILAQDKAREAAELSEKYKLDKRLVETQARTKIARQQRNFSIAIAVIIVVGLFALYRWITYRKKKEADMLVREHKQLERLDSMKTKFFANISHELRTPLTLIMGPLDQVINNDQLNSEEKKKHLKTVWRNSKKLLAMVNELLDLGKIEAGKMPVKNSSVNLASFIMTLYQAYASAAEYKNVRYSIISNIPDDLTALIDKDKLEKIINNLLGNAVKFTPAQGAVYVNASAENGVLNISVANSGTGIHPDDLQHIFERYYQGNREGAIAEGGTGIGLALAKEFTELLQGSIEIENDYSRGTVFKINIPYTVGSEEAMAEEKASGIVEEIQLIPVPNGKEGEIMIVEDHPEMAAYISSVLNGYYKIIRTANGIEALQKLQEMEKLPELIVSDVMMPEMDGFTLLKHLKQHEKYYRIPVVMLTALADANNKLLALSTGVDDYITKPFLGEELLARVNNLIKNAAQRFQSEAEFTAIEPVEEIQQSPADLLWLNEVEKFVRNNIGKTDLNLSMLSYDMAISERQLNRRIKSITGLTPNKYIRTIRLQIAREAIESGKYRTVAEIAYTAGFETPAYFSKLFKEHYSRDVNSLL